MSLTRLIGFACKRTEEIEEACDFMEYKEFLEERELQIHRYNIHQ
jgi:hypothetical protein